MLSCHQEATGRTAMYNDRMIEVEVFVSVPEGTTDENIFLTGNLDPLGNWRADACPLRRLPDGRYHASIGLPEGISFEFKLTRGSWLSVEVSERGDELPNHQAIATGTPIHRTVARWKASNLRLHPHFHSQALDNERTLIVYLPPGYDERQAYPVFYLQDGQNIFDDSTAYAGVSWNAAETADRLILEEKMPPLIMVGIYCIAETRWEEYSPIWDPAIRKGGDGDRYGRFLVEEVKPFIDKTYATRQDRTGIGGSSLGGLISLYLCASYPEVFSRCAALSPVLGWKNKWLLRHFPKGTWLKDKRIWFDMGTEEGKDIEVFGQGINWIRDFKEYLDRHELACGRDYCYQEVAGGRHHERDWAKRFDEVLLFLYGN